MNYSITPIPPFDDINKVVIISFSDASFNTTEGTKYGQTGIVNGI